MVPAVTYEEVRTYIASNSHGDYGRNDPPAPSNKVTMVGLLFARPDNLLVQAEVIPNLSYFHYRSGKHIDFFCAGYDGYTGRGQEEGYREVGLPGWVYSDQMFNQLREEIEAMSKWRYSGDVDLILTNAHYDARIERCTLTSSAQ